VKQEEGAFSRRLLLVLVIIVVVVSVFGTWTVLNQMDTIKQTDSGEKNLISGAEVGFTIKSDEKTSTSAETSFVIEGGE